jgi:hypothetical protein
VSDLQSRESLYIGIVSKEPEELVFDLFVLILCYICGMGRIVGPFQAACQSVSMHLGDMYESHLSDD